MKKIFVAMSALLAAVLVGCTSAPAENPEAAPAAVDNATAVMEVIKTRRSIRNYEERPVNRDTMQIIMEAGILAPNGMNKQSYEVKVVDNPEFINGLTDLYKAENPQAAEREGFKTMFNNAHTVAFIGVDDSYDLGRIDAGLLGENMILSAWSMGVGSCCLGGVIRFMTTSEAAKPYVEKLGFSEGVNLMYAIAFGYPAETPDAKPRNMSKAAFVD